MLDWGKAQGIKNYHAELIDEKDRTPMIYAEIQGASKDSETILYYGHLDKQPHMTGWAEGLGPITPVERDGKLYGRGGADDGYAWFGAILALKALQTLGYPHPRVCIIIEADEESGSADVPHYLTKLKEKIGTPSLVICTDSGTLNYD